MYNLAKQPFSKPICDISDENKNSLDKI